MQYRGIPIEQLAEKSSFLEVTYLLIWGELPTKLQLEKFGKKVMHHTYIHTDLERMIKAFRYDAHPMGMLGASISALGTIHPEANPALNGEKIYKEKKFVNKQIYRILGNIPTLAAYCYRHRIGRPNNQPRNDLSYIENFLYMMDYLNDLNYKPHPTLTKVSPNNIDINKTKHFTIPISCFKILFIKVSNIISHLFSTISNKINFLQKNFLIIIFSIRL